MARTTIAEVKLIMDNCAASDAVITSFITAGSLVVDQVFATTALSDALMEQIECWFVAHMLASTISRMGSEEKVGDASIKYTGQWGKKLESTPYGQMVLILDSTGQFANMGKSAATISAVKSFDE